MSKKTPGTSATTPSAQKMQPQKLSLRKLSHDWAQATSLLGKGVYLDFEHEAGKGRLSLHLASDCDANDRQFFNTQAGDIILIDSEGVLNTLSSCPAVLEKKIVERKPANTSQDAGSDSVSDADWNWQLYNFYLADQVKEVLGHIKQTHSPTEAGMACLIKTTCGKHAAQCKALIAPATLKNLLRQSGWRPLREQLPNSWVFTSPICLGKTHFKLSQLRQLAVGEIVLATRPLFSTDGRGVITLANREIEVEFLPSDIQARFSITRIEEQTMSDSTPNASTDDASQTDKSTTNDSAVKKALDTLTSADPDSDTLDTLSCEFSIHSGSISLALGELRRLEVGTVLVAQGESPGYACLKMGHRLIARGELVDVGGRLGLQITNLEF